MLNPDPLLQACTETLDGPKITVKRDGRRATFVNPERASINCLDVDCWTPASDQPKADYILSKQSIVDVIVELKGKDIEYAAEQIVATWARWKAIPGASKKFGGLIVFTRCPFRAAEINNMKKRLLRQYGLWMEIDKDQKTEYRFETFTGHRI